VGKTISHVASGFHVHRDWIEPELAPLQLFLKPGSVLVDIGENVGVYTLKAAKEVGDSGTVIAVEAFIENSLPAAEKHSRKSLSKCESPQRVHRRRNQTYSSLFEQRQTEFLWTAAVR
jgi:hypothetical protein